jgi:hypothetical protein
MDCLQALAELALNEGMIAAGFIRNLIWDYQHDYPKASPLNDIDVVWYNPHQLDPALDREIEQQLHRRLPNVIWQVRNQARMHLAYQTPPYPSAAAAVGRYPETATCLSITQNNAGQIIWQQSSGLQDAWSLVLKHNSLSYASATTFRQRIAAKQWLKHWPRLSIESEQSTFGTPNTQIGIAL